MAASAGERALVITPTAAELRRLIGVTAWAVLEELMLTAQPSPLGALDAQASTRHVALRLGISKNTAAKALRHLAAHGLARRHDHRDTATGVFTRSVYELDATRLREAGVRIDLTATEAGPMRRRRSATASIGEQCHGSQRSLFELATEERP